jgi:hypothetical protein
VKWCPEEDPDTPNHRWARDGSTGSSIAVNLSLSCDTRRLKFDKFDVTPIKSGEYGAWCDPPSGGGSEIAVCIDLTGARRNGHGPEARPLPQAGIPECRTADAEGFAVRSTIPCTCAKVTPESVNTCDSAAVRGDPVCR